MTHKVAIIQPWIPQYRYEFFDLLKKLCLINGIELSVYAPEPSKRIKLRKDYILPSSFYTKIKVIRFGFRDRSLNYFIFPRSAWLRSNDLVIMEQTLQTFQLWTGLLCKNRFKKIALWGHGETITKEKTLLEREILLKMTKKSRYFFSYTESGFRYLTENGYPSNQIKVVFNSNYSSSRLEKLKRKSGIKENGLSGNPFSCIFVGSLDDSKRVDFLINASLAILQVLPEFTLTIYGDGPLRKFVEDSVRIFPHISYGGFADQDLLEEISEGTTAILNPGRVGLIAVDALMLKLPIVTTDYFGHAPEIEYITSTNIAIVAENSIESFAANVVELLRSPDRIKEIKTKCEVERDKLTVEKMAENFLIGIVSALQKENPIV